MALKERIHSYLELYPGRKAREIADALGEDKAEVNSCLYRERGGTFTQLPGFRWSNAAPSGRGVSEKPSTRPADSPLSHLCRYYLACLAKDIDRDVSAFAASKFGPPDYAELASLPFLDDYPTAAWQSESASRVLTRVRADRKLSLVVGYPTRLAFRRAKSGWEGFFVEPLLLFEYDVERGSFPVLRDARPEFNTRALRSLCGQSGLDLLDTVIQLRQELCIDTEGFTLDDFIDMIDVLTEFGADWPWIGLQDPRVLDQNPAIAGLTVDGIYNRCILLPVERSPYTQGLESELRSLESISEPQYRSTALGHFLAPTPTPTPPVDATPLIEILPLNSEQRAAVQNCLTRPLTVITGPPGTGKSQVVTSIIVNCAWRGQTVLFASKINKAVDVVATRVNALGPRPILRRLGTGDVQANLAEYLTSLLATTTQGYDEQEYLECERRYRELVDDRTAITAEIEDLIAVRNEAARLEQDVEQFRSVFPEPLWNSLSKFDVGELKVHVAEAMRLARSAKRSEQGFLTRLLWIVCWRGRWESAIRACAKLDSFAGSLGLQRAVSELSEGDVLSLIAYLDEFDKRLHGAKLVASYWKALGRLSDFPRLEQYTEDILENEHQLAGVSQDFWELWLRLQPSRLTRDDRQLLGDYKGLLQTMTRAREISERIGRSTYRRFYQLFPKLTKLLPAWAVTNLAARGRVPLEPGFFDLLVIDEASQCDIASALPLLYRCKRVAVIGDPKQLRHITKIAPEVNHELMQEHGLAAIGERWSYTANSLFDLAASVTESSDVVTLRDHFRSRSEIIEFSNRHFYEGRLRVATKETELRIPAHCPAIRWIDQVGSVVRPSSGGAVNRDEARVVVSEVERILVDQGYDGTLGVVTPFRMQANHVRDLCNQSQRLRGVMDRAELLVDTVYGFQGDERDVMIFSPVVSQGMPQTALGFLRANPNTFNVAITRARAALIVVGDHGACVDSEVEHLASFARYVQQSKVAANHDCPQGVDLGPTYPGVANPERVSDWERKFYCALYQAGIRCVPQFTVEKYTLDLALIVGDRRLDVEVDGEEHRSWNGDHVLRDQIRNRRMIELGWDVMRFWVYQVRDEMQTCVRHVMTWYENALKSNLTEQSVGETSWSVELVGPPANSDG